MDDRKIELFLNLTIGEVRELLAKEPAGEEMDSWLERAELDEDYDEDDELSYEDEDEDEEPFYDVEDEYDEEYDGGDEITTEEDELALEIANDICAKKYSINDVYGAVSDAVFNKIAEYLD